MAKEKDENRIDRLERLPEEMFAGIDQLRESQTKTDRQMRRTEAKLDRIAKQLWDLGLVQIDAEDLFYRNLKGVFKKTTLKIKAVKRNLRRKGQGKYNLVAVDGGQVLVVEVKNKLDKRMVDKFLEEKLPRFKALFPEYEKYQVVGGMGALVVKDDVGKYAEKAGLYVLTQTDEGGATLLNREGFEPRAFN